MVKDVDLKVGIFDLIGYSNSYYYQLGELPHVTLKRTVQFYFPNFLIVFNGFCNLLLVSEIKPFGVACVICRCK